MSRRFFLIYLRILPVLRRLGYFRWKVVRKLARSIYLRIRRGRVVKITFQGRRWWVPVQDKYFTPSLLLQGEYEPGETVLVQNTVRPGMVVLDIGAHVGYYTCLAAALTGPAGRVFAFEPMPFNRRLLQRNITGRGYSWATVVPMAVSDEPGSRDLHLNPINSGDNRLTPLEQPGRKVPIRTIRIDDWLPPGLAVDFVKMDVQGWEWHALKGMQRLLEKNPRVILLVEVWPAGLESAGGNVEELVRLCGYYGLALHLFDGLQPGSLRRANVTDLLAASGSSRDAVNAVFRPL